MTAYTVIFERGGPGEEPWGAYVPYLPGGVTIGATRDEAQRSIREAIGGHTTALRATSQPVPEPAIEAERVAVAA